jgi:hypothetical protein
MRAGACIFVAQPPPDGMRRGTSTAEFTLAHVTLLRPMSWLTESDADFRLTDVAGQVITDILA